MRKERVHASIYVLRCNVIHRIDAPVSARVFEKYVAIIVNGYADEYKYAHEMIPNVSCVVVVDFVFVNDQGKGFSDFEFHLDIDGAKSVGGP